MQSCHYLSLFEIESLPCSFLVINILLDNLSTSHKNVYFRASTKCIGRARTPRSCVTIKAKYAAMRTAGSRSPLATAACTASCLTGGKCTTWRRRVVAVLLLHQLIKCGKTVMVITRQMRGEKMLIFCTVKVTFMKIQTGNFQHNYICSHMCEIQSCRTGSF